LPNDWQKLPEKEREEWMTQFGELDEHLRTLHISTLSEEEQREFEAGTHPSLNHSFSDRAQPFAVLLKEELARLGYNAEVTIGYYHFNNIVLNARLDLAPPVWLDEVHWLLRGSRLRDLPSMFRGFKVGYLFRDTDGDSAVV
jgi:hypothetical protein